MTTTEDLKKVKIVPSSTDVSGSCTRERANTKWKFHKLTNVANFAATLKNVPMGCTDTVLQDPLLKTYSFKCLIYKESTRKPNNDNFYLFRALALHLHGNEKLEEKNSKLLNLFLELFRGIDLANF